MLAAEAAPCPSFGSLVIRATGHTSRLRVGHPPRQAAGRHSSQLANAPMAAAGEALRDALRPRRRAAAEGAADVRGGPRAPPARTPRRRGQRQHPVLGRQMTPPRRRRATQFLLARGAAHRGRRLLPGCLRTHRRRGASPRAPPLTILPLRSALTSSRAQGAKGLRCACRPRCVLSDLALLHLHQSPYIAVGASRLRDLRFRSPAGSGIFSARCEARAGPRGTVRACRAPEALPSPRALRQRRRLYRTLVPSALHSLTRGLGICVPAPLPGPAAPLLGRVDQQDVPKLAVLAPTAAAVITLRN